MKPVLIFSLFGLATGSAATEVPLHIYPLLIASDIGYDLPELVNEIKHLPKLEQVARAVFRRDSISLQARSIIVLATGVHAHDTEQIWSVSPSGSSIVYSGSQNGVANCYGVSCTYVFTKGGFFALYRGRETAFNHILRDYSRRTARRRCDPDDDNGEKADACESAWLKTAKLKDYTTGTYSPSQAVWLKAFDGTALRWERSDDRDSLAVRHVIALSVRGVPQQCHDYLQSGYESVVSACGLFVNRPSQQGQTIYYCMRQVAPGYIGEFRRCVPLYRRIGDVWQVALVAGIINDSEWGGGASSSCTFTSIRSAAELAQVVAVKLDRAFHIGLTTQKSTSGSFLVAGSDINVDVSRISPHRPWAYLATVIRLSNDGHGQFAVTVNIHYTVSAQHMRSRIDGHETDESEDRRIAAMFKSVLFSALEPRLNKQSQNITCEEGENFSTVY